MIKSDKIYIYQKLREGESRQQGKEFRGRN